jgi:hypothetical protein
MIAWFVKLRLDLTHYLERVGHISPARPKLGRLVLVEPRLAWHGWRIAIRRRITTTDEVVELAELFVAIIDDARAANVGRRLAKRTAWRAVYEMSGGRVAALPHSAEVATVALTVRSAPAVEQPAPTVPVQSESVDGVHADRPEPSTGQPSAPTGPSTDRATTDRPSAPESTTRPSRTVRRAPSAVRLVWSPAVRENAAALRARYGSALPSSVRKVRDDMGWSADRAKPAVQAYIAGADQQSADDEEERAAS